MSKPLIDIDTRQVGGRYYEITLTLDGSVVRPDKLYDADEMERLVHDLKELYDYYVGRRW